LRMMERSEWIDLNKYSESESFEERCEYLNPMNSYLE
jgi:hypothetical protein